MRHGSVQSVTEAAFQPLYDMAPDTPYKPQASEGVGVCADGLVVISITILVDSEFYSCGTTFPILKHFGNKAVVEKPTMGLPEKLRHYNIVIFIIQLLFQ